MESFSATVLGTLPELFPPTVFTDEYSLAHAIYGPVTGHDPACAIQVGRSENKDQCCRLQIGKLRMLPNRAEESSAENASFVRIPGSKWWVQLLLTASEKARFKSRTDSLCSTCAWLAFSTYGASLNVLLWIVEYSPAVVRVSGKGTAAC